MIQFMGGGGAKQRMVNYRLCRRYDWTQISMDEGPFLGARRGLLSILMKD